MTIEVRPVEVPVKEKTVADVLRHAALLIEERGLCQDGAYGDDNGSLCAIGSINVSRGKDRMADSLDDPAVSALYDWVWRNVGDLSVIDWNDSDGRTAEEVAAALRATAWELS
jgi:hypothetical protein